MKTLFPAALIIIATAASKGAEVMVKDRASLAAALTKAEAGTVIRLQPGTYAGGLSASGLKGTREKPVVITAADGKNPPVIEGGASGIQLSGCSWVTLEHLHFSGAEANGINIDDGGSGNPAAAGIVLRHLKVTNTAPRGNRDGIKLSGLEDFTVEHCSVVRWGAGGSGVDMVGCHRGTVQDCRFEHDGGMESNGVQMKGGTEDVTVRRCHFQKPGGRGVNLGGSTGAEYFRPRGATFEARRLTVEDCVFVDVQAPVAFVGVDGATVQHCTMIHPGRWALRILQENRGPEMARCRNGQFSGNLVLFQSSSLREAVNIGPDTEPGTFRFEGNAWHCEDRPEDSRRLVRLPSEEKGGIFGKAPVFTHPDSGDYSQAPASPTAAAGARKPSRQAP